MIPTYRELGLLATAILKMDGVGGLAGWRWIFVCSNMSPGCVFVVYYD